MDEDPPADAATILQEAPVVAAANAVEEQTSQKNNDGQKTGKKRASVIKGWVRSKKRQRQEQIQTPAAPQQGEDRPP